MLACHLAGGTAITQTSQNQTPNYTHRAPAGQLTALSTFDNIPWGQRWGAGGAGGCGLGGRWAAAQDGSIRLILQDAGHVAPLFVLGQACGVSGQRCSAGAQLVEADGPVFSPTRTGLQRGGEQVCARQTHISVTGCTLLGTTSGTPLLRLMMETHNTIKKP